MISLRLYCARKRGLAPNILLAMMLVFPAIGNAFQLPQAKEDAGRTVIQLPRGELRLDSTIELDKIGLSKDLVGKQIFLRGDPQNGTVLLGSKAYPARKPTIGETLPDGIRPSKNLRVIDADDVIRRLWARAGVVSLGCTISSDFAIFHSEKRLTCARWPNSGYARSDSVSNFPSAHGQFKVEPERARIWSKYSSLVTGGYFRKNWFFDWGTIVASDGSDVVTLTMGGGDGAKPYALQQGLRYFVAGAPEDLDAVGEYISDPKSGRIFVLVDPGDPDETYEIPYVSTLLRILDLDNVTVSNLQFKYSISDTVSVSKSNYVEFKNVTVSHSQEKGISIAGGGGNVVDGASISDTGKSGISLVGGDRSTLTGSQSTIRNSTLTKTSQIQRTYNAAISIGGVGVTVETNKIFDTPHIAITFSGNNNNIRNNEISYTCTETADSGAIYSGRDWTQRGNMIVGNYFHDIGKNKTSATQYYSPDVKGVYLDDMLSGTFVGYNIFANVTQPVFIGGGRDNQIVGNIFVNPDPEAIYLDDRALHKDIGFGIDDPQSTIRKNLMKVPYNKEPYTTQYPQLANILADDPGAPKGNQFLYNLKFGPGNLFRLNGKASDFVKPEGNISIPESPIVGPDGNWISVLLDKRSEFESKIPEQPYLRLMEELRNLQKLKSRTTPLQ